MADPVPLNRAALARRYGVDRSAITRALQQADKAHRADPTRPVPPTPLNPGAPNELFDPAAFDVFWRNRPGPGRPMATPPAHP